MIRIRKEARFLIAVVALAATAASCGGSGASLSGSSPVPGSSENGNSPSGGSCRVTLSGDKTDTWSFQQSPASISTDYWLDEAKLRDIAESFGADAMGGSYDELIASGRPIVALLSVTCTNPDDPSQSVFATPTNDTVSADLPMDAGVYDVVGGIGAADGQEGSFVAGINFPDGALYMTTAGPGKLTIFNWDHDRIDGTLQFSAESMDDTSSPTLNVDVEFSYVCSPRYSDC